MSHVTRIDTIFVPAFDPEAAAAWYARIFGLRPVLSSAGYVGLRFEGDGERAALTLYRAESIDRDAHYRFNLFSPDPIALRQLLIDLRIETTAIGEADGLRYFDFRDISGNWVNVCAAPGPVA